MVLSMKPIGCAHTKVENIPRHWTVSDVEGKLKIFQEYQKGLRNIEVGQRIVVLFYFHKSPPFAPGYILQTPPHRGEELGVFSICSPVRPNPIGLSVLEVLEKKDGLLRVKGVDMLDGTPVLDIKPHIETPHDCPSCPDRQDVIKG